MKFPHKSLVIFRGTIDSRLVSGILSGVLTFCWFSSSSAESVGHTTFEPDDKMKQRFAAILSSFDRLFGSAPYRYYFFLSLLIIICIEHCVKVWQSGAGAAYCYLFLFVFVRLRIFNSRNSSLTMRRKFTSFWWRTKSSVIYFRNSAIVSS